MPSDSDLVPLLSIEVENLIRDVLGEKRTLVHTAPERMDRRYSFIFRYAVVGEIEAESFVLVKIPHQSWMLTIEEAIASEQLRSEVKFEYDVLCSLEQVVSSADEPQFCAVKPLGVILNWNAIVVEELSLIMMKDYLVKSSIILGSQSAWKDFSEKLYLTGKWLRIVHEYFSQNKTVPLGSLDILDLVLNEIVSLEGGNISRLDIVREKVLKLYGAIVSEKIPLSSVHDDYHLGNIFVTTQGKVGVLDPNWKEDRPIFGDLSKLLVDPAVRKMQVALQGGSFRPSLQTMYEQKILSGYFGEKNFSKAVLWFYCAFAVLEKWNLSEETLKSMQSRFFYFLRPLVLSYVRNYFFRLVDRYLNKGLRSLSRG